MARPALLASPLRITVLATVLIAAVIAVIVILTVATRQAAPTAAAGALPGTRETTHVLDEVGPQAPTLVEFLDFECEACGAFHPVVEQLRAEYAGEINFAIRYFPLPRHANSMNAALAVEAAAQQGEVEAMYNTMYETQAEWGEKQESEAARFRTFAEDLGLDMAAYDAAVADPATQQRVEEDFAEGRSLGITGTPSFFLDGEPLALTKLGDLTDALDAAIAD